MAKGSSKSTGDQTSSDSGLAWGNMADSDLDTASGDCLSWLNSNDVSVWTTQKRYRKWVRGSCKLSKGSDWMEAQMQRTGDSHQDILGHDVAIVRSEQKCALAKDWDSFEMQEIMVRTDQLLHIVEATDSKVHQRGSEGKTDGRAKS